MSKPTILCVDDAHGLQTLRSQLTRHFPDCAIATANSGTDALQAIDEQLEAGLEVPLVIADQNVLGAQGEHLLFELHQRHPEILKVMLIGQPNAEEISPLSCSHLYRFLAKPWHEADLILTVTEALRRYQHEHQLNQQHVVLAQAAQEIQSLKTDLANQQQHTQQLKLALDFNQQVIATAQDGIIVWDRDLRYCVWNQFMEDLSGYPAEAILGKYCLDMFPFLQESGLFALIKRALAGETVSAPETFFHLPETGKSGWSSECPRH
jgi:PAS domain S-box-containing protein